MIIETLEERVEERTKALEKTIEQLRDAQAQLVQSEKKDPLAWLDNQVIKVQKVHKDHKVKEVYPAILVKRAHKVHKEFKDHKVQGVLLVL